MITIKIELECENAADLTSVLHALYAERDELKARIAKLEQEPLRFSRENLARCVVDDFPGLTPDQRRNLRSKIETVMV